MVFWPNMWCHVLVVDRAYICGDLCEPLSRRGTTSKSCSRGAAGAANVDRRPGTEAPHHQATPGYAIHPNMLRDVTVERADKTVHRIPAMAVPELWAHQRAVVLTSSNGGRLAVEP
jgi:hypothetical protein